jgi:hypothetical protein
VELPSAFEHTDDYAKVHASLQDINENIHEQSPEDQSTLPGDHVLSNDIARPEDRKATQSKLSSVGCLRSDEACN